MGDRLQQFGDVLMEVIPAVMAWVRRRLEAGDSGEAVVRDIRSRLAEVAEDRAAVDAAFAHKFGEPLDPE